MVLVPSATAFPQVSLIHTQNLIADSPRIMCGDLWRNPWDVSMKNPSGNTSRGGSGLCHPILVAGIPVRKREKGNPSCFPVFVLRSQNDPIATDNPGAGKSRGALHRQSRRPGRQEASELEYYLGENLIKKRDVFPKYSPFVLRSGISRFQFGSHICGRAQWELCTHQGSSGVRRW